MDETYLLKLSAQSCAIEASTVWGALRAMETFAQLLVRDAQHMPFCEYESVYVNDAPRFTHRGVMIDTARHYLPLATIRSMVDILPMSKFNTLHIHLVDAESFPFNSPSSPRAIDGAYSPEFTYSKEDLNELTQYASDRGVRVVYEIDVPVSYEY
jgi:hexosaminidase